MLFVLSPFVSYPVLVFSCIGKYFKTLHYRQVFVPVPQSQSGFGGRGGVPLYGTSRLRNFAWLSFCLPSSVHCLVSAFCPRFSVSTGHWTVSTSFLSNLSRALVVSYAACNHNFASNHSPPTLPIFPLTLQKRKHFNPSLVRRIFIACQCHRFFVKSTRRNFLSIPDVYEISSLSKDSLCGEFLTVRFWANNS